MVFMNRPSIIVSGYVSDTAGFVAEKRRKSYEILQESNALGLTAKGTFQRLKETQLECSVPGWDGERAIAVSGDVLELAQMFLLSLPWGIEMPEISAERDGAMTLEWSRSSSRIISISINPGGWIYYASILGSSRQHGVDFLLPIGVSENLVKLISLVTATS